MSIRLKNWYVNFISKGKRNLFEELLYLFLVLLSHIFSLGVAIRNLAYDKNIFFSYRSRSYVISIGNLSWSGSGKTPLAILLNEKLKEKHSTAILRRGYGDDEMKLLEKYSRNVFSNKNRVALV